MTIVPEDFHDTKSAVSADERGRVALGAEAKEQTYTISRNAIGQILLTPVVMIPAHEAWLMRNQPAQASIQRGVEDAAAGRVHTTDFSQYADVETDD
jgi:predicted transcriptional regulator